VPDYRNSTVPTLEISLAFRKHPEDRESFLHRDKTYFHLLCNYTQTYLLINIPPTKNPNNTFSFPKVQLFAVAVYMDKPKTTDISRYSCNGSNNRHADI
jgi:hypothetical protein